MGNYVIPTIGRQQINNNKKSLDLYVSLINCSWKLFMQSVQLATNGAHFFLFKAVERFLAK